MSHVTVKDPLQVCPLCRFQLLDDLFVLEAHFGQNHYYSCKSCQLVFLNPKQRLTPQAEKTRYQLHDLGATDPKYLLYLNQLSLQLNEHVREGEAILDFGCGQSSVVKALLSKRSVPVAEYDPYFQSDRTVLRENFYQHIVVCEAAEHFSEPRLEFDLLFSLCAAGGRIYVQTKILKDPTLFESWHYRKDPTHISFYNRETMSWIKENWKAQDFNILGDEVTVFKI